jgi:hypothetical protein
MGIQDPLVRGPDPSIIKQNYAEKTLDFYCFATLFLLFIFNNDEE